MKILKPFLLLLGAMLALGVLTPTHARAQVTVSFFYNSLDPYGEWVQDPDYGYVWHPTGVDENWAPYTDGYWAYTDGGWTWVSYEDYGGVVYHYGRWAHVPDEGWVWVPGYTWAPAWVSWRTNDDYIGWAPLPPEARWNAGFGFGRWVDARFDIGPGFYSFVGVRDFGAPALGAVIVNREQNVTIINNTTNITNITVNNSNVYTGGPSYEKVAARSSRPIPTLKLVRQSDPSLIRSQGGKILSRQQGSQLMVIAPHVTASSGAKPEKVARTLAGGNADHGWSGVKDPQEREKLQAHIKSEAGSENAPARAVNPDDVKLVSEKIKNQATSKTANEEPAIETPKTVKTKTGKKTPDINALENAPATEEPGTAGAGETPKKGKGKKSKETDEYGGAANADETPYEKKSKKSKEPGDYEGSAGETPSKHKKKSSDENLQPFMSGDEESGKSKSYEGGGEKSDKSDVSDKADKNYEPRPYEGGNPAGEAGTPKKKSKKSKEEEQGYPPGPGQ